MDSSTPMRWTNGILALAGLAIIGVAMLWKPGNLPDLFFTDAAPPSAAGVITVSYILAMFLLMVLGILLGQFYAVLAPNRPPIPIWREFVSLLGSRELARSILASPIVFGVVYSLALRNPDPIMVGIIALQNGFFCHSVINQMSRHPAATTKDDTSSGPEPDAAADKAPRRRRTSAPR